MQLRVLIVDDEPLPRAGLRLLLEGERQSSEILEARNGPEAVALIHSHRPNLVLLDVQMPRMDGFQVIDAIGVERMPAVVFVTAFDSYALRAFEMNAIDYLLKPVDEGRFRLAMERVHARIESEPTEASGDRMMSLLEAIANPRRYLKRLAIRASDKTFFINVEDIDWIEAAENYVQLNVGPKQYLLHVPMNTIAASLDPEMFLRVRRSIVVNLQRIKSLYPSTHGQYVLELDTGVSLRSGRTYLEVLRALTVNRFQ